MSILTRHPNLNCEEEALLVKQCIAWNGNAQDKLYKLFAAKMFAVCVQYSKNREEAEDTFHEAFIKVYENLKSYSGEGSLEGWIRRIMVNTAIDKYWKNSHLFAVVNIDECFGDLDHYNTNDVLSKLEAHEMMKLIQSLPPCYKMVFNLFVFEGLKHKEIAKTLGISEGTSKSNLNNARAILKKAINQNRMINYPQVYNGR